MNQANGNLNGNFAPKTAFKRWGRKEMMAHYDSLPREYRDVIKDTFAPTTIVLDGPLREPGFYRNHFLMLQRESTRVTYGPDHPQAA